jgi:hypothetical protein
VELAKPVNSAAEKPVEIVLADVITSLHLNFTGEVLDNPISNVLPFITAALLAVCWAEGAQLMNVPSGFSGQEWSECLSAGRELVSRDNQSAWDWGDAALKVYPMTQRGGQRIAGVSDRSEALQRWMKEIECPHEETTILSRRQVSDAWGKDIRISLATWTVHQTLMSLDDRADVIRNPRTSDGQPAVKWTKEAARAYVNAVKRDATTRTEIFEMIHNRVRDPLKQGVTAVVGLLETLTVPIPATGVTGKADMLAGIAEARAALDLLESKINGNDIDSALEDILSGG